MTVVQVTHMLQAARFKTFEKVLRGQRSHSHPALHVTRYQVMGRPVTGLWAAMHLLLKVLPDPATDVLGYLSKVCHMLSL